MKVWKTWSIWSKRKVVSSWNKRKWISLIRNQVLILILILILLMTGCQNHSAKSESKDEYEDRIEIGMVFDTFVLERWIRDRDVFVHTAEKLGANVDVQNANGDVEKQRSQIERFIKQEKDAIVLIATDCFSVSDLIKEARAKGIKVISYDRLVQGEETDLYITVDNEQVGQRMAEEIMEKLPGGGNIVMICGPEMDSNSLDVQNGFIEEIGDGEWEIIYKNHVKSWTPENGFEAVMDALDNSENVDAIMCGNDGLAGYAIRALSEMQLAGSVVVVGQDADLEACQRIVEGTQSMTVYKPIEELAKTAATATVELVKGEYEPAKKGGKTITKTMIEGGTVPYLGLSPIAVTKENMDEVIIDSAFHLREEVYLNVGQENVSE